MSRQWMLLLLLQCGCLLTSAVSSPEPIRIPPSGIFVSVLTSRTPNPAAADVGTLLAGAGGVSPHGFQCGGVRSEAGGPGRQRSVCLWTGGAQHLSPREEYRELRESLRSALPSHSQIADQSWSLLCWRLEKDSQVTCEMRYVTPEEDPHQNITLNLYYAQNNSQAERRAADCRCRGYRMCECGMVPPDGDACTLWMEIITPISPLLSPPMAIDPAAILKPEPPSELSLEITSDGKLKVLWAHPSPSRLQYQVKHYFNTSEDSSQRSLTTEKASVILDVAESCSALVFEVRCRTLSPLPGVWSDWSQPLVFRSQDGFYFPQSALVSSGSSLSVSCMVCHKDKKVPSESISWGLNLAEEIPAAQYTALSPYVGKVTISNLNTTKPRGKFGYDALYCCTSGSGCQPRYAKIYVIDVNISITCEADGQLTSMTCRWSAAHSDSLKDSLLTFRYYDDYSYCQERNIKYNKSTVAGCTLREDGSHRCVFSKIKATNSYYMWVDIQHPMGRLRSTPACVRPIEVVRPSRPYNVRAEMMLGSGYLDVSWRTRFTAFDFAYQLRYRMDSPKGDWKVLDINNEESVTVKEVDSSRSYLVQVRCRKSDVADYWSDWSDSVRTDIRDIRAPLKGPDFWRISSNDTLQKGDNVTLIWQPPLNSPLKYEVLYETSSIVTAPVDVGNATNYTFTLQTDHVTVSVQSRNSLGHSEINRRLTFSQKISAVQAVKSLEVYLLNSSVVAVWTLLPTELQLVELVLEWQNLRYESSRRWVIVSPNISRYYIEGHFFAIEKYQFSLTPVFLEGVGSPKRTYEFSKEDPSEMQNPGFYVILPAITASSFLLVITLAISHQRMKRIFWKDVPNPKYCSWAQGVNFQKPDTLENLFSKPRDHLAHSFPLILEPEAVFENLNILKDWENEAYDASIAGKLTDDRDSAHTSSQFSSGSTYPDTRETIMYSGSPSVRYATIITNPQYRKPSNERKLSVSSCDGCFIRSNSIVIGDLDNDKQTLLIVAGLQTKQPGNMSSNSTVSSEGFSEPSDEGFEGESPEKNLYYMGFDPTQNGDEASYFSESPLVTYHIQEKISYGTIDFSRNGSTEFLSQDYGQQGLGKKPYVPQYQTQATNPADLYT